jgi:hypothetical protein
MVYESLSRVEFNLREKLIDELLHWPSHFFECEEDGSNMARPNCVSS